MNDQEIGPADLSRKADDCELGASSGQAGQDLSRADGRAEYA